MSFEREIHQHLQAARERDSRTSLHAQIEHLPEEDQDVARMLWEHAEECYRQERHWQGDVCGDALSLILRLGCGRQACLVRVGHEVEDLRALGPVALCSTELLVELYQSRVKAEAESAALHEALRRWAIADEHPASAGYDDPERICAACRSHWKRGAVETHRAGCLAAPR